jgi:hypothetical protein
MSGGRRRLRHVALFVAIVCMTFGLAGPAAANHHILVADSCGIYMQGSVDPAGGVVPAGLFPAPATINTTGQGKYFVAGHESKGQTQILSALNDATPAATRLNLNVTVGGTINGNPGASGPVAPVNGNAANWTTNIKAQWKNDANGLGAKPPVISVTEANSVTKVKHFIAKGFAVGVPGEDSIGPQIGRVQTGITFLGFPVQNAEHRLVTPASATSGTFALEMVLIGLTITVPGIPYNVTAAGLQSSLQSAFAILGAPGTPTVTGTNFVANAVNGDYVIEFGGALAGANLGPLTVVDGSVSGTLATTVLDDGSIWNGTRYGGVNPDIGVVIEHGPGVFSALGIMSTGPIPSVGEKTTGKWYAAPEAQFLVGQYPVSLVDTLAPTLATNVIAQGIMQTLVGPSLTVTTDQCGLLGLFVIACNTSSWRLPATFDGLCAVLT